MVSGILGIVGGLLLVPACLLPFAHFSSGSPSIVNPGDPASLWFALEPGAVIVVAIAIGIMLAVSTQPALQIIAGSILLGTGVSAVIGIVGAISLTTGGLLAAVRAGWLDQPSSPESTSDRQDFTRV